MTYEVLEAFRSVHYHETSAGNKRIELSDLRSELSTEQARHRLAVDDLERKLVRKGEELRAAEEMTERAVRDLEMKIYRMCKGDHK